MTKETTNDIVKINEEGDEEQEEKETDTGDEKKEEKIENEGQEGEEGEEGEEEEEEEEEEEVKHIKKRRCQRRKKIQQICLDDEYEYEEEEEQEEEEEFDEEEEESNVISYGSTILSAITFEWENEIYEFEELCDPGNIDNIYQRQYQEFEDYDEVGLIRYLQLCRALAVTPMMRIIRSLKMAELNLSRCNMNSKSIRAMCAALEMNNVVRRFIMRFNKLVRDDCYYIGLMLKRNETISVLDFTGCRVGPVGLQLLMEHLPGNEVLVDLNLSKCNIGDEGMKLLAHGIARNNSIEKLDLSYNRLGDEAAEALATAFKLNNSITDLNLSYNSLFNPNALRGFFRSLTVFNNSISRLNLTWNGLSGSDIGGQIGNFLRKSRSIEYLDLADNRFEGLAVVEIKKGLSKSNSLEVLKIGKNPMTSTDLEVLLSAAKKCPTLRVLNFEDIWVRKNFFKILQKILKTREMEVIIGGVYSDYQVLGPDYPKLILQRAQFEAQKPKSMKKRKDFGYLFRRRGHLIWILGDEPLTEEDFMIQVKKFKAKINRELFPELMKVFTNPRTQLIDVMAMRKKYLSIFPESTPPPPPKPKKGEKVPEAAEAAVTLGVEEIAAADLQSAAEEDEEGELMIEDIEGVEEEYLEEFNMEEDYESEA